jgi:hypothetical protein
MLTEIGDPRRRYKGLYRLEYIVLQSAESQPMFWRIIPPPAGLKE